MICRFSVDNDNILTFVEYTDEDPWPTWYLPTKNDFSFRSAENDIQYFVKKRIGGWALWSDDDPNQNRWFVIGDIVYLDL